LAGSKDAAGDGRGVVPTVDLTFDRLLLRKDLLAIILGRLCEDAAW
jgi:hypothetical protein